MIFKTASESYHVDVTFFPHTSATSPSQSIQYCALLNLCMGRSKHPFKSDMSFEVTSQYALYNCDILSCRRNCIIICINVDGPNVCLFESVDLCGLYILELYQLADSPKRSSVLFMNARIIYCWPYQSRKYKACGLHVCTKPTLLL